MTEPKPQPFKRRVRLRSPRGLSLVDKVAWDLGHADEVAGGQEDYWEVLAHTAIASMRAFDRQKRRKRP